MKQYYLKNGDRITGPFLLDDLKYQRISPETLYRVNEGEWQLLHNNVDLNFLFKDDAKLSNNSSLVTESIASNSNVSKPQVKSRLVIVLAIAIFFLAAGMAFAMFMVN